MASPQQYSTNTGLTITPEFSQEKYPGVWADSKNIRNAIRILQAAIDSYGGAQVTNPADFAGNTPIGTPSVFCVTSEAIGYGSLVNLYDVAGVLTARKASALDSTKPCRALCVTPGGVALGATGQFAFMGSPACFSGVTRGATYYLSTTAGFVTTTAPATPGNIVQPIGFGISSSQIWFNPPLTWIQL